MKKKLVILSGAGISKESGIDTFRDKDGLWKKHDALKLVIDPGEVEVPEGFLHIKEAATVGMEMLYQSLIKLPYV